MITLDKILLLQEKVDAAVKKISALEAQNKVLKEKEIALEQRCSALQKEVQDSKQDANAKEKLLFDFRSEQSKIEQGIISALNRLNSVENYILTEDNAPSTQPQPQATQEKQETQNTKEVLQEVPQKNTQQQEPVQEQGTGQQEPTQSVRVADTQIQQTSVLPNPQSVVQSTTQQQDVVIQQQEVATQQQEPVQQQEPNDTAPVSPLENKNSFSFSIQATSVQLPQTQQPPVDNLVKNPSDASDTNLASVNIVPSEQQPATQTIQEAQEEKETQTQQPTPSTPLQEQPAQEQKLASTATTQDAGLEIENDIDFSATTDVAEDEKDTAFFDIF